MLQKRNKIQVNRKRGKGINEKLPVGIHSIKWQNDLTVKFISTTTASALCHVDDVSNDFYMQGYCDELYRTHDSGDISKEL